MLVKTTQNSKFYNMFYNILNFTTCHKNVLIAAIVVARHYQRELLNLLNIYLL